MTFKPTKHNAGFVASAHDITGRKKSADDPHRSELKRSEAKFRSIFEESRDGLMITSAEGRFIEANAAALDMFGCPDLEAFLQGTPADYSPPEQPCGRSSAELAREHIRAAVSGQTVRFEWIHRRGDDGREFPCDITLSPIELDGQVAVLASAEDLTERKRTEEALRKAEADFRMRTETIKDVIWVFDPETRLFQYVSPSCLKLFGYTPEELYDKKVTETVLRGPDQTEQVEKLIREGMESFLSGKISDSNFLSADMDHTHKDGSIFHVEIVYRFMRNADTERVEVLGSTRDITERKLAQEALHEREKELEETKNLYQFLLENSTDVVMQLASDDTIEWVSPSVTSLLGWRPEQMLGHAWADYVHPVEHDPLRPIQTNLPLGIGGRLELRVRTAAGGYRWVSAAMRPLFDKQGAVTGRVAGLHDIQAEVQSRGTLEAERARLRAAIDSLLDPFVILHPIRENGGNITDFVFADANPAACAHDKIERDKLVGRSLLSLLPNHRPSGLFEKYCETIETGRPLVLRDFAYHDEMQNGQERRVNLSAAKVGEALSLTWRDVTDK